MFEENELLVGSRHNGSYEMATTILVLDGEQRSALAVTRSLGNDPEVVVHVASKLSESISGASKYCSLSLQCPDEKTEPQQFIDWINNNTQHNQYDYVFPCTETTSQLLVMSLKNLPKVKIPFAPYNTVMQLANKSQLMSLAGELDIKIPNTSYYASRQEVDFALVENYPIVVKPSLSQIWTGTEWITTKVHIARSQQELEDILLRYDYFESYSFMLQEFIEGHGEGYFCLFDRGQLTAQFCHQRLREKPPQGGVSVLCQSREINQQLQTISEKLLTHVNWHGVAMVEFRVDNQQNAYLMEVNTRFWGSLQLAIDSGVDFPWLLLQVSENKTVNTTDEYRVGQKMRWLLGDLDSLYLTFRDAELSFVQKLKAAFIFLLPDFLNTRHQVARLGDLKPGLIELKQYLQAFNR